MEVGDVKENLQEGGFIKSLPVRIDQAERKSSAKTHTIQCNINMEIT